MILLKLDQISGHVYANTEGVGGGNVCIIVLTEGVVAVDSGFMVSGRDFRQSIATVTDKPVTHLLLTHYHRDHVLGTQAFEDCQIVGHRLLKAKIEANLKTEWTPDGLKKMMNELRLTRPGQANLYESDGLRIILPTKTFEDRYVLEDGSRVEMVHTGGHTAGSSFVYIPEDKVLFTGDNVTSGRFPWAGDSTADPDAWIEAFKTLLKLDCETIIPGHGPLCDKSELTKYIAFFQAVKEKMQQFIREGRSMEETIKYEGYPKFYEPDSDRQLQRRHDSLRQWYRVWSTRV